MYPWQLIQQLMQQFVPHRQADSDRQAAPIPSKQLAGHAATAALNPAHQVKPQGLATAGLQPAQHLRHLVLIAVLQQQLLPGHAESTTFTTGCHRHTTNSCNFQHIKQSKDAGSVG
jgi:hypothetical protein